MKRLLGRVGVGVAFAGALLSISQVARGQTWTNGRQGPSLGELFAIDKTGEPNWLYGQEDVAGDGLDNFKPPEQSIDIRTAYASTDAQRFWARVYVSATSPPGGNVTAYVFIDSDRNAGTGGPASATTIDPAFTTDPSGGGYEYVLAVRGNGAITGVWQWSGGAWTNQNVPPPQTAAEAGVFLDPIRVDGDTHGYLQGAIDLGVVGLTQACAANLYVRTTESSGTLGKGDLEVGQVAPCVPADSNGNGVPDPIEQASGCTADAQCPNGGVCLNGKCLFAAACTVDADCPAGYTCTNGRCVVKPTGTACSSNAQCNGLVCTGGQCVACTPGGSECGSGYVCGPDGRCRSSTGGGAGAGGLTLPPDAEIQGGACSCSTPGGRGRAALGLLVLSLASLLGRIRRRRSR